VESLKHNMVQRNNALQNAILHKPTSLEKAFHSALTEKPESEKHLCCLPPPKWKKIFESHMVRSVQRIPLPHGMNVAWMAAEYGKFHHTVFRFLVRGETKQNGDTNVKLRASGLSLLELSFSPRHSHPDRVFYFITGGILTRPHSHRVAELKPRLEFRRVLSGDFVIVALHDYVPALPWPIYAATQALAHLMFMWLFANKMRKISKRLSKEPSKFPRA
jgi:hypothetical protein